MHELAIAESILRIASEHAAGRQVHRVDVKVGYLRQVVPDSLAFAWEVLTPGTWLDGAELHIERVPAIGRCRGCGAEGEQDGFPLSCAVCGGLDIEVVAGEELLVDALELENLMTTNGRGDGR